MAKKRRPRRKKSLVDRRHPAIRRTAMRRRSDFYFGLGKFAGLIATVSLAILGQAELIGEPWRHYVTVTAIIGGTIWAYCMPGHSLALLKGMYTKMRAGKSIL